MSIKSHRRPGKTDKYNDSHEHSCAQWHTFTHSLTMKVLIGTHAFYLHLVDFDPSTSTITKVSDIKLREQPSYALPHPIHKDLFYVTAWVDSIIYVMRIDEERGAFEVLGQAQSGGGGPTHFVLSPDGESLIMANVSILVILHLADDIEDLILYAIVSIW